VNTYILNNNSSNPNDFTTFHNNNIDKNFGSHSIQKEEMSKVKEPNLVVNSLKTNKVITEKDLINDLIFVFQGIDGHYINFNSITNAYCLNPLIPFNDNLFDIVSILSELGWLYRKVNNHMNFFNESNIPSQFIQSFSFSIQNELSEYYK
jgi:gamma-tubulin complex component 3